MGMKMAGSNVSERHIFYFAVEYVEEGVLIQEVGSYVGLYPVI
jgi:hypothetical protein